MARTARIQSLPLRSANASEKDVPLRDDIRLLGRILGDTVREQEGEEVFGLVEQIRQASIRFHRDNEIGARRELEATLDSLNADQTLAAYAAMGWRALVIYECELKDKAGLSVRLAEALRPERGASEKPS